MQSALAIIPFPLAAVETLPNGAEPTDQGFALAFDEGLISPEGEVDSSDSMPLGPVLSPFWIGPALSVPAVVPSGIEGGENAGLLDAESAAISGTNSAAPDLSRAFVALGVPGLRAENTSDIPTAAMPLGSEDEDSPNLPGKVIAEVAKIPSDVAFQLDQPPDAMPVQGQAGSWPAKARAPLLPLQPADDAEAKVAQGLASVAGDAAEIATITAKPIDGHSTEEAAVTALLESESPYRKDKPIEDQIVQSETSAAQLGSTGRDIERPGSGGHSKVEVDAYAGPVTEREAGRSVVDENVVKRSEPDFALLPREPSGSQTLPTSFWERVFAGLTESRAATGLQVDQGARLGPETVPKGAAVGTAAPTLVDASLNPISLPTLDLPPDRSKMVVLSELPTKGLSTMFAVESPPLPADQAGLIPPILLSQWDEGLVEVREQTDLALLSGPVMQSGSGFGGPSSPQSPLSLPVQQVAAQLARVLVDVSDKVTELALAPEELGRVRLRLEPDAANPDRMTILINVERPETLDLFRRHAGELAEAIKAAGYSGADIGFGQDGQGGSPDQKPREDAFGSGRPSEDQTPVSPARRDVVGSTLDLRL